MRFRVACILLVTALLPAGAAFADEIPLKDFARLPEFTAIKISPDGAHLAVNVPTGSQRDLVVLDTNTLKVTGRMHSSDGDSIGSFWWVNSERLVAELGGQAGPLDVPSYTGELVGMNADGSQKGYLFGYQSPNGISDSNTGGRFISRIDDDPEHILIAVRSKNNANADYETVQKLDVYTGSSQRVLTAPAAGTAHFLADHHGNVRYVQIRATDHKLKTFWRKSVDDDWVQDNVGSLADAVITPLAFDREDKSVYLSSTESGDKSCLVQRELSPAAKRKILACDDDADLAAVIWSFDEKEPIAAVFEAGFPVLKLLLTDNPDRDTLKALVVSFGSQWIWPVTATKDGSKVVLYVMSDHNSGEYYLYDQATRKARFLLARYPWFSVEQMAERRPINYKARDGHTIWGYLTLPNGKNPSQLPMVVNPHGGPFDNRDTWLWDRDAQLLASRGYAVLQINFRGTFGYGKAHSDSAKHALGTTMIDDITDGARWATAQGYADSKRLCIYGEDFGGYAAVMSAVREPDLYRCVVGYAGIYDLPLWRSDIRTSFGRGFIAEYFGEDSKQLRTASPLTYIDKLKSSIMIVHGKEDHRAPYNQAKALRSALEDRKYPYEWLVKGGEYHGFYLEKDNEELFTKLIAFLDKNIGKDAKPADSAPAIAAAPAPVAAPAATAPSP